MKAVVILEIEASETFAIYRGDEPMLSHAEFVRDWFDKYTFLASDPDLPDNPKTRCLTVKSVKLDISAKTFSFTQ